MLRQLFCTLSIIILSSPLLCSADWRAFRGPDGNGKSPDTGLQKQWAPGGPKLLWSVNFLGDGWSGVSIAGDRIYISGNAGDRSMVFCFDKEGNEIWRKENGPAHNAPRSYPGTRGTPTIDGAEGEYYVYDISPHGELACFHAATGDKIWRRNIMTDYGAPMPMWFLGHSVIIDGDLLITPVGGASYSAAAVDKKTGRTVWTAPPAAGNAPTGYTTPYIFEFEGTRVVAVMSNASVEGLDPATGKRLFSIPWTNARSVHCTMPIYHNGYLFLSTGYDRGTAKLFRLAKNTDGTIRPTEVWSEPQFNNHHGGVVLVGDHVYGTNHNGAWCSINFMTGEMGYTSRAAGKGALHYADGLLYGLTEDDKTALLIKPEPKEFLLLSSFELPNDAAGKSWAHPVVLNGRMYLRHGQYLYCYNVKAEN